MKKGGFGGANTNKTGLSFENQTNLAYKIKNDHDLKEKYELVTRPINSTSGAFNVIRKSDNKQIGVLTKQMGFYEIINSLYGLKNINHKKWKPDDVFFNTERNTVFIVEKKWQSGAGSVDEKIFGFGNKRKLYQKIFNQCSKEPKVFVEFCALFNKSWWIDGNNGKNKEHYQDYFDSLRMDGIKIFFDNYEYWWFGL